MTESDEQQGEDLVERDEPERDEPERDEPERDEPERDEPERDESDEELAESDDFDDEEVEPPSSEEVADTAVEFVAGLIEAMGIPGEVSSAVREDRVHIDISGEDLGPLIGRRGQALDALQEVTRTAVQRRLRSRVRLLVDVEGYRARRRESLIEYAQSMARRAIERGTEIELEPMNSFERKVVHDAIGEIEGASSFSEGEEPNRKVIVRGE